MTDNVTDQVTLPKGLKIIDFKEILFASGMVITGIILVLQGNTEAGIALLCVGGGYGAGKST
jgi:hypothetical protein